MMIISIKFFLIIDLSVNSDKEGDNFDDSFNNEIIELIHFF